MSAGSGIPAGIALVLVAAFATARIPGCKDGPLKPAPYTERHDCENAIPHDSDGGLRHGVSGEICYICQSTVCYNQLVDELNACRQLRDAGQ